MDEKRTSRRGNPRGGLGLLTVQSLLCAFILLAVLALRFIGGTVYEQLRTAFENAIHDDSLATALTEDLFENDGQGGEDLPLGVAEVSYLPNGASFSLLETAETPHPLLFGGTRTSSFGYRTDPIDGGTGFHTGVDIAAPSGTPLYAVLSGTVTRAGWHNSYGRYVVLTCENGLELWYAHCSALKVNRGDTVCAGDTVALVGSTGKSTGAHVHFMAKQNGTVYDPTPLIGQNGYV